jgi:AraC-like DNA-binding protein
MSYTKRKSLIIILVVIAALAAAIYGVRSCRVGRAVVTNWYIRADGGSRSQCDGKHDAAYPGSGTNQPCGFNDFRWLYDDQTYGNHAWVIAGSDIITVESCLAASDGPGCQVGFSQPTASGEPWCSGGNGAIGCTPPAIPSGTPSDPTTFRGANYAACTAPGAKQILHGSYDMSQMFDVRGSHDVVIECFEVTGYSSCRTTGDGPLPGDPPAAHYCANNYPYDDNMQAGMVTNNTSANIYLQDVNIHRVTNRGIQGPIGGLVDLNRVRIAYTGQTGWDLDDGNGTHSLNGTLSMRNSIIEWAGAIEEFPDVHNVPTLLAFDDAHGTVADCIGTPDTPLTVQIDRTTFRYCTQDGPDVGHIDGNSGGPANVTITNSIAYGNSGQQFKWGGVTTTVFTTNLVIGNCHRLSEQVGDEPDPRTHLGDFCRAAGDTLSFQNLRGGTSLIAHNTIIGYNNEFMLWGCWDNDGAGHCLLPQPTLTMQNNIFLGFSNPNWNSGTYPNLLATSHDQAPSQIIENHNSHFHLKGGNCGAGGAGDLCVDPLLVGGSTYTGEAMFDNYGWNLTTGSPAKYTGVVLSPAITTDNAGNAYHVPPSMGGLEYGSAPPPPTAATPTGAPPPGTFTAATSVALSTTTTGAKICYTTNGSTPTTSANNCGSGSTTYSGSFSVPATTTIKAIATLAGYTDSAIFSGLYTINIPPPPTAATPTGAPPPGTFTAATSVALSTTTSGAKICYTTNGTTPTTSANNCGSGSTTYSGSFSVPATTTIKAIATLAGYTDSAIFSGLYTINSAPPPTAATPTGAPPPGTFTAATSVALSTTTSGAKICYTTNGSTPTTTGNNCGSGSTTYSGSFSVATTTTIKAIATLAGYTDSAIFSGLYTINAPQPPVATPTAQPMPGTFPSTTTIALFTQTTGATICYTINSVTPACGAESTVYTSPIIVPSTTTIKAIATLAGRPDSGIFSGLYTITAPPVVIVVAGVEIRPVAGVSITNPRVINGHVSFTASTTAPTTSIATVYYKSSNLKYLSCGVIGNGDLPAHGLTWSSNNNNTLIIQLQNPLQPGETLDIHVDCWTS